MTDKLFRLQRPSYDELVLPGEDERFDMPGTATEFLDMTYSVMGNLLQRATADTGYQVLGNAEIEPRERTVVALNHVSNMDTPLAALVVRGLQTSMYNEARNIPGTLNRFTDIDPLDRSAHKDPVAVGKVELFKSPLLAEFFATGSIPAQRGEKPSADYDQSKLLDRIYSLDNFAAEMLYSYIRLHPGQADQRMAKLRQVVAEARKLKRKPLLDPAKNDADYNLPTVDRRTTLNFGQAVLDDGRPLVIFPQGTRSEPGGARDIESGVALFAEGAKVVPIGHDGTQYMGLRHKEYDNDGNVTGKKRTKRSERGPVVVALGQAIDGPSDRSERKVFLSDLRSELDRLARTAAEARSEIMSSL